MWTYMMAAARGDRANSMMSNRRRPETESPKYGYNPSRPMYRTTRFMGPSSSSAAASSSNSAQLSMSCSGSSSQQQHQYQQHQQQQQHRQYHQQLQRQQSRQSAEVAGSDVLFHTQFNGLDSGLTTEEVSGGLYAPFTPTDSSGEMAGMCLPSKQLNANQSSDLVRIPMANDSDDNCVEEQQLQQRYPPPVTGYRRPMPWQPQPSRQQRIDHACNDVHDDDSDDYVDEDNVADDDDDDDDNDNAVNNTDKRSSRKVVVAAVQHAANQGNKSNAVIESRTSDENSLENGRKLIHEQSKRSKSSALRRTLQALRQRLTKRNRTKPPDWFLEKFSNTTNTDKIAKNAMDDAALSSEIRGSSALCNRLSVDPTLQSHYRWLAIVSLAVLYNIIFVVGRAVFWEINKSAPGFWYTLDYLCDFIYLLDTLVHMHEGFLDQGLLVRDAFRLRRHYFHTKGWYLDVLSMLPTDLAYIWWPPETCSSLYLPCPVIVRLNRLLRLPRLWEWFDRTETATGYPNAFRICKVVLAILVLIHWNACMYFAISYELGFSTDNWVYNLNGTRNNTLQRQYIYSFYWSTLTLTTIGETPTPENDAEYLFVVADFLAGVLIFATIVGNIGSMISNMNVARVEFQNRMDGVKQYMAFRRVGHELEARVIRWFAYTWSQSGALDEERVLAALPDKLKAEIAIQVHMDTLKQVRIFHDTEPGLLEALVLKLKLQVFSPGDYICRKGDVGKEMYIVKRGKLSVVGDDGITVLATLGAGSVFGEVSVLEIAGNRTGNRRTANVRSLGYSDLFCLAKRDLWETLADYPEARSTLTQRGCQLLRKDGLLDEQIFSDSQRVHDSIEGGIEKLELSVENLNMRLARLLAEYTASQAKIKQRLAKLELNDHAISFTECEPQTRIRSGRLYSLQPKRRPRSRPLTSATARGAGNEVGKQNTL